MSAITVDGKEYLMLFPVQTGEEREIVERMWKSMESDILVNELKSAVSSAVLEQCKENARKKIAELKRTDSDPVIVHGHYFHQR